jgi:DNA-binding MarR family transcriptional regulator
MEQNIPVAFVATLERVTHAVGRWLERELSDWRLSQAEAHIMAYLAVSGARPIGALHLHFGHRRSTLTSVIDRLEARGLLRRAPNPASRRSMLVELTEAGCEVGAHVTAQLARLEMVVGARTTGTDREGFFAVLAAVEEETR